MFYARMSRNNLIAVIKHHRVYYIMPALNADTEWDYSACVAKINHKDTISRMKRGDALCAAHDLQMLLDTEYGVREVAKNKS